jgi:hypothetical protein
MPKNHQDMHQAKCQDIPKNHQDIHKPCIKYFHQTCAITSMLCIKTMYQWYAWRIIHIIHDMPQLCTKIYASNYVAIMYQNMSQTCTKHVPKYLICPSIISHDLQNIPQIKCLKSPTSVSSHVPNTLQYMPQGI